MRPYLALIQIDIKLAARDRSVIFFNYLFPLIFFFVFSEMMGASRSGGITNVVTMVLTIGILGNGLWGAGMRAVPWPAPETAPSRGFVGDYLPSVGALQDSFYGLHEIIGRVYYELRY